MGVANASAFVDLVEGGSVVIADHDQSFIFTRRNGSSVFSQTSFVSAGSSPSSGMGVKLVGTSAGSSSTGGAVLHPSRENASRSIHQLFISIGRLYHFRSQNHLIFFLHRRAVTLVQSNSTNLVRLHGT